MTKDVALRSVFVVLFWLTIVGLLDAAPPAVVLTRTSNGLLLPLPVPPNPEVVLLSREKYQELLEQVAKLQAQLAAQQPNRPRSCELEVRIETRGRLAIAKIKATYKFSTTQARSTIFLGCKNAQPVEAKLADGKAPLLLVTDEGLAVQVEQPGDYQLQLDLDAAIVARGTKGTEYGYEVGLPAAPITLFAMDAPSGVKRYTLTTKSNRAPTVAAPVESEQVDAERYALGKGGTPMGPITSLAVLWEDPKSKVELPKTAESDILVTVSDDEVLTTAKLRLRGNATEWRFAAPATADVVVTRWQGTGLAKSPLEFPADRAPSVLRPEPGQNVWKIQFRDPPTSDLLATVTVRALRPRTNDPKAKSPFLVGPFDVLDAAKQTGVLRLKVPANVRPTFALKGDTRRDVEEEGTYRYARLSPLSAVPKDPYAELTLTPLPGVVSSRLRHELRLVELGWRIRTEISVAPTRTEIEQLELEVPPSFQALQAEPRDLVEGLSTSRDATTGKTTVRVRLTGPKTTAFSLTIEGEYRHAPSTQTSTFALPALLNAQTRDHEAIVFVPSGFDVRGQLLTTPEGAKTARVAIPLELQALERETRLRGTLENLTARLDLQWKPIPSQLSVRVVSDIDWHKDRATISQQFTYRFTGKLPTRVHWLAERPLPTPRTVQAMLEPSGDGWDALVPSDVPKEWTIVLNYSVPHKQAANGAFLLNILRPEQSDALHTIRIWSNGTHVSLREGEQPWQATATEWVEQREALPDIVLQARGNVVPPVLQTHDDIAITRLPLEVGRGWMEVVLRDRVAHCRMLFELERWTTDDVTLLLPVRAKQVEALLNQKSLRLTEGTSADNLRPWRLRLPANAPTPLLLEVRYELPFEGVVPVGVPVLEQATGPLAVQWKIVSNGQALPLFYGGRSEGAWSLKSFLNDLNLRPATPDAPRYVETYAQTGATGSLRITTVTRTMWLLSCSLTVGVLGLILAFLPALYRKLLLIVLLAGSIVAAVELSQVTARVVGGALPGLLAVGLLALTYRVMQQRYRRRLLRSSSFARTPSTFVRPSKVRPPKTSSQPAALDPT